MYIYICTHLKPHETTELFPGQKSHLHGLNSGEGGFGPRSGRKRKTPPFGVPKKS